jgi:hypothetical protein
VYTRTTLEIKVRDSNPETVFGSIKSKAFPPNNHEPKNSKNGHKIAKTAKKAKNGPKSKKRPKIAKNGPKARNSQK